MEGLSVWALGEGFDVYALGLSGTRGNHSAATRPLPAENFEI